MKRFLRRQLRFILVGITCLILLFGFQNILQAQVPPPTEIPPTQIPTIELTPTPAELPPLPYEHDALEPYIDAETMELHHRDHHAAYVDGLNAALENQPQLQGVSVEEMLLNLEALPAEIRTDVRNNGGGHVNHSMFWEIMSPDGGGEPTGTLAEEINNTFGSFEEFQSQFDQAGENIFGSGWVWLVYNNQNQLQIVTTANQDTPIMVGMFPIMGNDVWEHAYYLNYRNNREEYLTNWWNVVNWEEIERRSQRQPL